MKLLPKLLLALMCLLTIRSYANNVNGGELFCQHISDSTYTVTLKLYWNCDNSLTEPTTTPLCLYDMCGSYLANISMTRVTAMPEVPTTCPSNPTKCTYPASTIPGTKLLTFNAIVTLPSRCSTWRLSSYYDHRNTAQNLSTSSNSGYYYSELIMNNTGGFLVNSSPVSTVPDIICLPQNVPYIYTPNLTDPNGDSVTIDHSTIYMPFGTSCNTSKITATLAAKSPTLNLANNPFQTGNTFNTNTAAKAVSFTPTELGDQLINLRIGEYRSGTQIGSYLKEIRFFIVPAPTYTINKNILNLSNCTKTFDTVMACIGQTFGFAVDIKSSDPTSIISVTDNHLSFAPSASVGYSAQYKDSVRANFSWPSTLSANYNNILVFTIRDSSCKTGFVMQRSVAVYINLIGKPVALNDTNICSGSSYQLFGIRGGGYSWRELPGGSTGSLSCTTCANPVVTPTLTTRYELTSAASAACGNNKDTVTIGVTAVQTLGVSLSPSSPVKYIPGVSVSFTATPSNCSTPTYVWKRNGTVVPGVSGNVYTFTPSLATETISCQMMCGDMCYTPAFVTATGTAVSLAGVDEVKTATLVVLYPNPNNGSFEIAGLAQKAGMVHYSITNLAGQTIQNGQYTVTAGNYQYTLKINLPAGAYILKLQDDDGNSSVQKLIIQ